MNSDLNEILDLYNNYSDMSFIQISLDAIINSYMTNDSYYDNAFLSSNQIPNMISIHICHFIGILIASNRLDTLIWINLHKLPDIITTQSLNNINWPLAISQPFAIRDTKSSLVDIVT